MNDTRQTTNTIDLANLLAIFAVIILAMPAYVVISSMGLNPRATLPMLVDGTAAMPFAGRILAPALIGWLRPIVTPRTDPVATLAMQQLAPDDPALAAACIALQIMALSLAMLGLIELARAVGLTGWRRLAAPWIALAMISILTSYPYDLPHLALMIWALWAIAEDRPALFLLLLGAACLSKETGVLLIPVWLLARGLDWPELAQQIVVAGLARLVVLAVTVGNPGTLMEIHLIEHLRFAQVMPFTFAVFTVGLLAALALAGLHWRRKPATLRAAMLGLCLPLAGLYVIGGVPGEFRALLEGLPVLLLMVL